MAEKKECEVCREMQKKKHKYDIVWKIIAVISTIIAIVFICLYACKGDVVKKTEVNNNVSIENNAQTASNSNIGNITDIDTNKHDNNGIVIGIVFAVIVIIGIGGCYACYIISQNRNKQQHKDSE